ncbi:MAG: AAA family ATPase, partial [Planctomycetota bacterium]
MTADPMKRLRDLAQSTGDPPPRIAYHDPTKPPDDWVPSVPPLPRAGSAVVRRLSEVRPEEVSWLWPQRIALGKLTMLAGDPGLGKSFVSLDLAARVSAGLPWPDLPSESNAPGGVVLLSAEDGLADTIRPRLDAAGADPSRVVALEAVRTITE